jgi:hypothetical protein
MARAPRGRRTSRRTLSFLATFGLAAGVFAGLAPAAQAASAPPATQRCPDGFVLQDRSFLDNYSVGGLQSADLNGNGKTCVRLLDTPSDIVFMDDVMR